MFQNVIVAVDGRAGGRDAIALAARLHAPNATLTLAHVNAEFRGRAAGHAMAIDDAEVSRMLESERDAAGVDAWIVARRAHSVADGLHRLARDHGADLLVVGSWRRALLGRVVLGNDACGALDGTPCPVAIAPRGYARAPGRLATLGVGYDGSAESELTLAAARELARPSGARIRALRVVTGEDVRQQAPLPADWPQATELLTRRMREQLQLLHGIEGDAVPGGAPEELERLSHEVDLLLIGSRAAQRPGHPHLDSVSHYLLGHAACPLVILPSATAAHRESATARQVTTPV